MLILVNWWPCLKCAPLSKKIFKLIFLITVFSELIYCNLNNFAKNNELIFIACADSWLDHSRKLNCMCMVLPFFNLEVQSCFFIHINYVASELCPASTYTYKHIHTYKCEYYIHTYCPSSPGRKKNYLRFVPNKRGMQQSEIFTYNVRQTTMFNLANFAIKIQRWIFSLLVN